jgi:hypothetical protein
MGIEISTDIVEPVLKRIDRIYKAVVQWRYWNEEAVLLRRTFLDDIWIDQKNREVVSKYQTDERVVATKDIDVIEALKSEGYEGIHEAKMNLPFPSQSFALCFRNLKGFPSFLQQGHKAWTCGANILAQAHQRSRPLPQCSL